MERNLCLLILLCADLFGADFIFSAHISTTNHIVTYQKISISPSMSSAISKKEGSYICTIDKKRAKYQKEYNYLLSSKDELFDCFLSQKVKVYENSLISQMRANTNTQIFIIPIYFRAIFGQNSCKIYSIKN